MRLNGFTVCLPFTDDYGKPRLQRNIPVLLWWVLIALIFEQRKRADQSGAGLGRLNYFINKAALGGGERGSSPTVREGVFLSFPR
jgi:hypothetical protein